MNVTVVFRQPVLSLLLEEDFNKLGNLAAGISDIGIGPVPLVATFVSSVFETTIPYEYTGAKWVVPCPQPVARMEKVMHTYQLPVWLTMATVFFLTVILWWGLANWRHSSVNDSRTYQTALCFYAA
jgi:hypothetical protein